MQEWGNLCASANWKLKASTDNGDRIWKNEVRRRWFVYNESFFNKTQQLKVQLRAHPLINQWKTRTLDSSVELETNGFVFLKSRLVFWESSLESTKDSFTLSSRMKINTSVSNYTTPYHAFFTLAGMLSNKSTRGRHLKSKVTPKKTSQSFWQQQPWQHWKR